MVAAVFSITFLSLGTTYSLGIFFNAFIAKFHCSKSEISAIASIAFCLQCFLGPVVSVWEQKYSTKHITAVGSVLVATAFIASSFAQNIYQLYFTLGIVGGRYFGYLFKFIYFL